MNSCFNRFTLSAYEFAAFEKSIKQQLLYLLCSSTGLQLDLAGDEHIKQSPFENDRLPQRLCKISLKPVRNESIIKFARAIFGTLIQELTAEHHEVIVF